MEGYADAQLRPNCSRLAVLAHLVLSFFRTVFDSSRLQEFDLRVVLHDWYLLLARGARARSLPSPTWSPLPSQLYLVLTVNPEGPSRIPTLNLPRIFLTVCVTVSCSHMISLTLFVIARLHAVHPKTFRKNFGTSFRGHSSVI